jgi:hypothetical protein
VDERDSWVCACNDVSRAPDPRHAIHPRCRPEAQQLDVCMCVCVWVCVGVLVGVGGWVGVCVGGCVGVWVCSSAAVYM